MSELSHFSEGKATRGVTPRILLQQVRNTAPFLFDLKALPQAGLNTAEFGYLKNLREMDERLSSSPEEGPELSHLDYYKLCLSAHYGTVASFVPTDVDNQIRSRLWSASLPTDVLEAMAELVLVSREWDARPVSARWIASKKDPAIRLGGHDGEWLSTAAGAYGALRKRSPELAAQVAGEIVREVQKSLNLFREFKHARDGVSLLITSALIAHNLGDLERVFEMWNIDDADPLKESISYSIRSGDLLAAGLLNKAMMALENHRHFALRLARPLRKGTDFLIGIGPFFDAWGARVASHPGLSLEEKGVVAETLIDGFEKLAAKSGPTPVGYARALAGMLERFPGGLQALSQYLPAKLARTLRTGPLRTYCVIPKTRFEDQMGQAALKFISQL